MLDLIGALASVAAALVCLTLAGVLFWRGSQTTELEVMFISSYLLVYGTVMGGPLQGAEAYLPWLALTSSPSMGERP